MTETTRNRAIALSMFAVWLTVVLLVSWDHAVWRDEVRGLSKALDGGSVLAMIRGLRSDSHPALWYLLLRAAHAVFRTSHVLQMVSLPVAAASALLLLLYSPFDWWVKALLLAAKFFLFEYSVIARNYGISMLLLFLLATFYRSHKERGVLLGVLLFLLANCSAPSVMLVGGFLLFWLVDVMTAERVKRSRALRLYAGNAAIALAGLAVCVLTVLPLPYRLTPLQNIKPGNAAQAEGAASERHRISPVVRAVLLPGSSLSQIIAGSNEPGSYLMASNLAAPKLWLSAFLFASTLGLVRYPPAFLASLATLVAFSVFFAFVYRGYYRHEALWLCFLIVCYWIGREKETPAGRDGVRFRTFFHSVSVAGWIVFLLLMGLQAQIGISTVYAAAVDGPPFSCSRDLANLIDGRPDLHDAIVMADPDYLLESLPFYLANPTYYARSQQFARFTSSRGSRPRLTLADYLADARRLHGETGKPVLILMSVSLDSLAPEQTYREAFHWEFTTTPQQIKDFTGATRLLESFPSAVTDEMFDVYLLK